MLKRQIEVKNGKVLYQLLNFSNHPWGIAVVGDDSIERMKVFDDLKEAVDYLYGSIKES